MFIDRVKINVKAGKGGDGIVSFRREKYVAFGGPDGGDGGKGGNIIFEVDTGKTTLLDLRYHKVITAANGGNGKSKKMHGANGKDTLIKVPQGTIVKNNKNNTVIADLTHVKQRAIIANGGKGGKGNYHFKSSKNTAPQFSELGVLGEELEIFVELKVLADVGLVGYPSVGKSTMLSVVSRAKPEIADYHFTTIAPNLGLVEVGDGRSFVMADLPGLIQGAHEGKGLGHQFLKHIERCRIIVHVIDMGAQDGRDPIEDFTIINQELAKYKYRLMERPQIVVANKMDLEAAQKNLEAFKKAYPNIKVYEGITLIGEGLQPILFQIAELLETAPQFPLLEESFENQDSQGVLYKFEPEEPPFYIKNQGNGQYVVEGVGLAKMFHMSKLHNEEDYMRFARKMRKVGLDQALRKAGCKDGDDVSICNVTFAFLDEE